MYAYDFMIILGALFLITPFAFILIRILCNRKFFKGDLFNMLEIMVVIHFIQICSILIIILIKSFIPIPIII